MRKLLIVMMCGILLGVAAPAMAQSPSQGAYSGPGSNQLTQAQSNTAQPSSPSAGTLPFTGLNVGLLGIAAVVLAGTGLLLRWQSPPGS